MCSFNMLSPSNKPIEFKDNFSKVKDYIFVDILEQSNITENETIIQNFKDSNFLMINQYFEQNEHQDKDSHAYIVIGFKKTIIKIEKSIFSKLHPLLSSNPTINIYFLSKIDDIKSNFNNNSKINDKIDKFFENEIYNFNSKLLLSNSCDREMHKIWIFISPCISGYLIKEGYRKTKINRLENFIKFEIQKESTTLNLSTGLETSIEIPIINENEFIELRDIYLGNDFKVVLIYHIEKEEIYVQKKQNSLNDDIEKLRKREINNYSKIQHPLIPKLIGIGKNKEYLIIEFINGRNLLDINQLQLNCSDKITIFFELMLIIEFLHRKQFIYRDLKPNNVMIDENKTVVLIDFDHMIEYENLLNATTNDFTSYGSPEVSKINCSYECDIYSLSCIFLYIMNPNEPFNQRLNKFLESNECKTIKEIISNCLNEDIKVKPSILEMIFKFYGSYHKVIQIRNLFEICIQNFTEYYQFDKTKENNINQNDVKAQYNLGILYKEGELIPRDMNKSIHYLTLAANQNYVDAQFYLGYLYVEGELIPRDMNKSIQYFTLAANQNHAVAQFILGYIYENCEIIPRNINKIIQYYTLAANQNNADTQYNLGILYKKGELIPRDMNKSIQYLTLAANQNHTDAQYNLGYLYVEGELIPRDMNKSIHYLSLAANQNHTDAQFNLGYLYEEGKLIPRDMNKSIHYYTLAANLNDVEAQFNLGILYEKGELIPRDMNKSIHYYTLAANHNDVKAQLNLGVLYGKGELIPRDMNKSIQYLTLTANQNNVKAQFYLGVLYEEGELIPRDMNKSIHYLSLAANQNHANAQFNLGYLYGKGELIPRDMNKSIQYYTLAANQNDVKAQFNLGYLYGKGELIPRDMNKSIQYLTLAANHNHVKAQLNLGILYGKGELIPRDMNKSIHYLTLAANQNDAVAQFYLGMLYGKGELIPRDMNKSIQYFTLAANQNHANAQYNLGMLYQEGELIPRDMNKSIQYYTLAANQNHAVAQYQLGLICLSQNYVKNAIEYITSSANQNFKDSMFILAFFNLTGLYIKKNPHKGVEYLNQCLNYESKFFKESNFILGYFHHIGLYANKDIKKAIKCYKEGSSFNYPLAKNNLGIIYKHGIDNEIKKEIGWAIEYFKESIKYSNHYIPMYNLAHLYFYENPIENSNQESIKLLLKSLKYNHYPSKFLLCIVSIYEFGNDIDKIIREIKKIESISIQLEISIRYIIEYNNLYQPSILKEKYDQYHYIDFIYDFDFIFNVLLQQYDFLKNGIKINEEDTREIISENAIDSDFYKGFEI